MTNRFRVSSALLKRLEDMGLSVPAVLEQAGGAPDTGLKLGSEDRIERYNPIDVSRCATEACKA